MSLRFPHHDHEPLPNAPLQTVICQVRFAPLLRILSEAPAAFQDRIRDDYSGFEIEHTVSFMRVPDASIPLPDDGGVGLVYKFIDAETPAFVALAMNFYALSTDAYSSWASFLNTLQTINNAFSDIYAPSSCTRVGLRYVNRFELADSASQTEALVGLFNSDIVSLLESEGWTDPHEMSSSILVSEGELKLRLGIRFQQSPTGPAMELDFDCFEEGKIPVEEVVQRCEGFHTLIYDAFRWSLSGRGYSFVSRNT